MESEPFRDFIILKAEKYGFSAEEVSEKMNSLPDPWCNALRIN